MASNTSAAQKRKQPEDDTLSSKKKRLYSNIVTLKVGKDNEDIVTVHETPLQNNSPFFKAALEKQWKEGQTRTIELPSDQHDTVAAYVDYLYHRIIKVDPDENGNPDFLLYAQLYCFGEKVLDDDFCDAVISSMMADFDTASVAPSIEAVNTVYAGTPVGSGIREFLISVFARCVDSTWDFVGEYCIEFTTDLIRKMWELREPIYYDYVPKSESKKWMKTKK